MSETTNKIDIASCISELLRLQDTVILPGLGALEGTYKAAVVDPVQGVVHPPSKSLRFNAHLKLNDGALVDLVAKNHQLSLAQAQELLEAYVARLRQALEKREIVDIPGVGRLYLDFEGHYKFMQGPENFHTPSFGLPKVQYHPVKHKVAPTPVPVEPVSVEESPPSFWEKINWRSPVLWILSLAVLILFVSVFFIVSNLNRTPSVGNSVQTPSTPSTEASEEFADEDLDLDEEGDFETGKLGEIVDTEGATRAPGIEEAVVIIGAFRDEINAEKQIQTIFSDGYEAYTDQKDGATRVGIRLGYESEDQLQSQLLVIQARYNKKAWVFYPEEE